MTIEHEDHSNGYEAMAAEFMLRRGQRSVGVATVREWARRSVIPGGTILDLGCGHGTPVAMALIDEGFVVHGIDASPTLVAEFHRRFPLAPVNCEAVEDSSFFNRSFDGVLAWGLLFLLPEDAQRTLIRRVAAALNRGGSFLFTSPNPPCTWVDAVTGRQSRSLGAGTYGDLLSASGLMLAGTGVDEGDNDYYEAKKS